MYGELCERKKSVGHELVFAVTASPKIRAVIAKMTAKPLPVSKTVGFREFPNPRKPPSNANRCSRKDHDDKSSESGVHNNTNMIYSESTSIELSYDNIIDNPSVCFCGGG